MNHNNPNIAKINKDQYKVEETIKRKNLPNNSLLYGPGNPMFDKHFSTNEKINPRYDPYFDEQILPLVSPIIKPSPPPAKTNEFTQFRL